MRPIPARGLTLTEIMVSIAIAGILAGLAVPAFNDTLARTRLEGAISGLSIDLQYTRSEALRRRTTARLVVAADGLSYTLSYTLPSTNTEVVLKTVALPADVSLATTGPVAFDSMRGIAPSQTLTGNSTKTSAKLQVMTNGNGRVQTCSPSGSFKSYEPC